MTAAEIEWPDAAKTLGVEDPEINLLYALLCGDERQIEHVAGMVGPDDFRDPARSAIYRKIWSEWSLEGKPAATQEVIRWGLSAESPKGCRKVLIDVLKDSQFRGVIAASYALDLLQRNRIEDAREALSQAQEDLGKVSPDEVFLTLEERIERIKAGQQDTGEKFEDAVHEKLDQLEKQIEGNEVPGVATGIIPWDTRTGGLYPGELVVVAARPGVGKTALGLELAANFSQSGAVGFFTFEMLKGEIVDRFMVRRGDVKIRDLRSATVTHQDLRRAFEAVAPYAQRPLYIYDDPTLTISQVVQRAVELASRENLAAIVVDYLQLVSVEKGDERINRAEAVGRMSRALKRLAMSLEIPVVALSQVNRESVKDGKIRLHHLRESGSIEQDANVVVFLQEINGELSALDIAKNRSGETFEFPFVFDKERQTFTDPGRMARAIDDFREWAP